MTLFIKVALMPPVNQHNSYLSLIKAIILKDYIIEMNF